MQSKDKAGVNLMKLLQSVAIVAIVFRHQNNGHTAGTFRCFNKDLSSIYLKKEL